jgi:hypothetical protein
MIGSGLGAAGDILYSSVIDGGWFAAPLGGNSAIDCSVTSNFITNPYCWQLPLSNWQDIAAGKSQLTAQEAASIQPPPAPKVPGAPQTAAQAATWTPEQAIAQGAASTSQSLMDFYSSPNAGLPSDSSAAPAVDCTSLWSRLTNTSCGGNSWFVPALAAGGVVVLLLTRGGGRR